MQDNEQTLDIFILTYKNFKEQVSHKCYKVVSCVDEKIDTQLQVLYDTDENNPNSITMWNPFYSELTMTYWIWKNWDLKDYVGVCHYRRYLDFFDNIPNIDEIFQTHDIIMPEPMNWPVAMTTCYALYHNPVDLSIVFNILCELYPEYRNTALQTLESKQIYACNMFIMKKDDFHKYCEFIFSIVNKYLDRIGASCIEDIEKHVTNNQLDYLKPFSPMSEVWYQMRIGGFLAERLFTIFVNHNFKNIKHYPVIITEDKYKD